MIGIIISGHGNFASGLHSSINLIAGEPINVEYVDFEKTDSTETLKEKYKDSLNKLNECDGILALADLAGGSPFKTLVEVSTEINKEMEVVGGVNLPMALEITMTKDIIEELSLLSDSAIEIGKSGVIKFQIVEREEEECEDGI